MPRRCVLATTLVFLALAPPAGAAREPPGSGSVRRAAPRAEIGQYHGPDRRQYHENSASSGQLSAQLSGRRSRGSELQNAISSEVISPLFTSHSPFSDGKSARTPSRTSGRWIGSQNDRSIPAPTGGDPRAMVQLGAALGLVYLAFLAVWFWATRFRMRPPRSAPS